MKILQPLLKAYLTDHLGSAPTDPQQLLPYAKTPEQQAALETVKEITEAAKTSGSK